MPGKLDSASTYIANNGFGSFARYARDRCITHSADKGMVWGLSSKKRAPQIIASLTSYPKRIEYVHTSIESLLIQTLKPDRITLWLAEEQFPGGHDSLPENLTRLEQYGLEICWCEDLRSHKKYAPLMREHPNALVCTFDDDIVYPTDNIEMLYNCYLRHPSAVSALRVHLMRFRQDGSLAPYLYWDNEYNGYVDEPRMQLFATTGAGALLPPGCLPDEAFDSADIMKYASNADDIWLKIMEAMTGTPTVLACPYPGLDVVPDTQDEALYYRNQFLGENDREAALLLEKYRDWFGDGTALVDHMRDPDWRQIGCPDAPIKEMNDWISEHVEKLQPDAGDAS